MAVNFYAGNIFSYIARRRSDRVDFAGAQVHGTRGSSISTLGIWKAEKMCIKVFLSFVFAYVYSRLAT